MVQPRVGATYALGENRTLLRASYARFTDQLDIATILRSMRFRTSRSSVYVWDDANGNGRVEPADIDLSQPTGCFVDPANPASFVPINQVSRSLEPPMTDEIIVGIERQFTLGLIGLPRVHPPRPAASITPMIGTTRAS